MKPLVIAAILMASVGGANYLLKEVRRATASEKDSFRIYCERDVPVSRTVSSSVKESCAELLTSNR